MVFETLLVKKPKRTPGAGLVLGRPGSLTFARLGGSGGLRMKLVPDVVGPRASEAPIPPPLTPAAQCGGVPSAAVPSRVSLRGLSCLSKDRLSLSCLLLHLSLELYHHRRRQDVNPGRLVRGQSGSWFQVRLPRLRSQTQAAVLRRHLPASPLGLCGPPPLPRVPLLSKGPRPSSRCPGPACRSHV